MTGGTTALLFVNAKLKKLRNEVAGMRCKNEYIPRPPLAAEIRSADSESGERRSFLTR